MIKHKSLDLRYMETMAAGDQETMNALLTSLRQELSNSRGVARRLYQNAQWAELERFCHHFKSTLSFSGNTQLINANLQLWDMAKSSGGNTAMADTVLRELEQGCQAVVRELNQMLK